MKLTKDPPQRARRTRSNRQGAEDKPLCGGARSLSLTLNGRLVTVDNVPEDVSMASFLSDYLNLAGIQNGCPQTNCHACTLLIEHLNGQSESLRACINKAHRFAGLRVRTVADLHDGGAPRPNANPPPHHAFQCSYCAPWFVNESVMLIERLRREPVAKRDLPRIITDALRSHRCFCTGYVRYHQALLQLIEATPGLTKKE